MSVRAIRGRMSSSDRDFEGIERVAEDSTLQCEAWLIPEPKVDQQTSDWLRWDRMGQDGRLPRCVEWGQDCRVESSRVVVVLYGSDWIGLWDALVLGIKNSGLCIN